MKKKSIKEVTGLHFIELIYKKKNRQGHYFDDDWLSFFGESPRTMSASHPHRVIDGDGNERVC